jgi:hypothetical protein
LKVPFHKRKLHPGHEGFEVGKLYRRKLVPVIREKMLRSSYLEPYELYWHPNEAAKGVVHDGFHSLVTFIDAHRDLQNSPGEPGCLLPRIIVASLRMYLAFGDAKLVNTDHGRLDEERIILRP